MATSNQTQVRRVRQNQTQGQRTAQDSAARSNGGARKKQKARSKRGFGVILALLLVVIAIVAVWALKDNGTMSNIFVEKFDRGISVAGLDVSGLTLEEAQPLLHQHINSLIQDISLTLEYEDQTFTLTQSDLGVTSNLDEVAQQALSGSASAEEPVDFGVIFSYNEQSLLANLAILSHEIDAPATEPHAEPQKEMESSEFFTYVEGQNGLALNVDATAKAIAQAVQKNGLNVTVPMVVDEISPTKTIEEVKANTQFIASYSTTFNNSSSDETVQNRVFNIKKAAGIINGLALQPGDQFSFNDYVGLRTFDSGWKAANGISGGKEYTLQAGGGICQVSTTLYNALLSGNVKIVYRKAHSIPSDYVPVGLDATVDSSGIDFQFQNDTDQPLYVFMRINKTSSSRRLSIEVLLYGRPLPKGVTYKPRSEVIENIPREDTKYTASSSIPMGYQLVNVIRRDGYVAEAYLDMYIDGKLQPDKSVLLQTNRYRGNPAEISIGTGAITIPPPTGATLVGNTSIDENGTPVYVDMDAINRLLQTNS